MKKKWKKRIEQVMEVADFLQWSNQMRMMNWKTWDPASATMRYPSALQLEKQALDYLTRVVEEKACFTSSGSITAIKTNGRLFLCFGDVIESED